MTATGPRLAANPRIPSYRFHKSSGLAVVRLNGQDIYLGKFGAPESHTAYERVVAEWLAAGRCDPRSSSHNLTINELILAYWQHAKGYYVKSGKPTSEQAIIKACLRRLRRLYGHSLAREFTPIALRAVRQTMIEEGLARVTINAYVSRIVGVFRWGVAEGIVPGETLEALRALAGLKKGRSAARETDPVRPIADEDVEATLPDLPAVISDMVRVQRLTGMRPGEVCALSSGRLETAGNVWIYEPREHKTSHHGKARTIAIGPRAQVILARRLHPELDRPLFCHGRGTGYTTTSYARAIRRGCEKAGVPRWTPNQLRHTCATEVRRSFGLDGAGAILGHTKLETTQVYAERSLELAMRIARETG